MERDSDILGRYRSISNKLKKKFLRKPNVAEGSEHFGHLSRTLKAQECPQYASFCSLAQARCEHTLSNSPGEAQSLIDAGRNFLQAELSDVELKCPGFQEHLNAAINCFSHAIRVYVEKKQSALAASLCLEVGNALQGLGRSSEAIPHYQRAAELHTANMLDCLTALGLVASCKIDICDYEGALIVLTEMSSMITDKPYLTGGSRPVGAYSDVMAQCEVTRVILLLLLQPTPQRLGVEHAKTLEKYTWDGQDEDSPTYFLSEQLFLLLQSTVLACQTKDHESLKYLQMELWPLLTSTQNELLHTVLTNITHPPGDGF